MLMTVEQYLTDLGVQATIGTRIDLGKRLTLYCKNLRLTIGKGKTGNAYPMAALDYFLPAIAGEGTMEIPSPPLSKDPVLGFMQYCDRHRLHAPSLWNTLYKPLLGCSAYDYRVRYKVEGAIWKALPPIQQDWLLGRLAWILEHADDNEMPEVVIAQSLQACPPPVMEPDEQDDASVLAFYRKSANW